MRPPSIAGRVSGGQKPPARFDFRVGWPDRPAGQLHAARASDPTPKGWAHSGSITGGPILDYSDSRCSGPIDEIEAYGRAMADKSPRQALSKKSGKTLKAKRADKKAKKDGDSGSGFSGK